MIAAVLQMNSGPQHQANLEQAAAQGAGLVVLPEHFSSLLLPEGQAPHRRLRPCTAPQRLGWPSRLGPAPLVASGRLFGPTRPLRGRVYNTSLLLDDQDVLRAHYQKIYLFDLGLSGQPAPTESRFYSPGRRLGVAKSPLGRLGLSICFDLRFPELYRRLRLMGASALAAPSAFTASSGREHWELLVRGRALENQCYRLAVAQWGEHAPGRASHCQAMIVDLWGRVLAQVPPWRGPGLR